MPHSLQLQVRANKSLSQQEPICEEVKGAIITNLGKLTPNFEYISDLRKQHT